MATTFQHPRIAATGADNEHQKRQLVYAKYRDFLGSYNDQANARLESGGSKTNATYP